MTVDVTVVMTVDVTEDAVVSLATAREWEKQDLTECQELEHVKQRRAQKKL